MEIKHIKVEHFRGINTLDWYVNGQFLCLIGPGDSTKSTILEAIELTLTPRRNVVFNDTDFYNADTDTPILIELTVGDIPNDLLSDAKFGYMIRGWYSNEIHDEPGENDQPVLTIQLNVDKTLEPTWLVINDRQKEGKRISSFDRAKFGLSRLRDFTDWQFSWAPGSALARLMDKSEDVRSVLAEARRQAKAALDPDQLPRLKDSAKKAQKIGKNLGVSVKNQEGLVPDLDVRSVSIGTSILALHDGPIPMRQSGLGSSRLLTLGLQHEAGRTGGITLIDEIEHGLEPYRLRRLLHVLLNGIRLDENGVSSCSDNQLFLTTHSPVALCELEPKCMRVVRANNGDITIKQPDDILRPLIRTNPDAFLARKVIVCEGKTELGFCRALDTWWASSKLPFAYVGAALADGQGNTKGPDSSLKFAELGYPTAYFGDTDKPINPSESTLNAAGVTTILWEGSVAIEERVALDLSQNGFEEMVLLAIQEHGEDSITANLAIQLNIRRGDVSSDPKQWGSLACSEKELRLAFAKAAKNKNWFKPVYIAEGLGEIVVRHWQDIADKPTGKGIEKLKDWIYD